MSRFKITGRVDGAAGATLTVDRDRELIAVRPKGRRRVYELTLQYVAEMIVARVVKQELQLQPRKRGRR